MRSDQPFEFEHNHRPSSSDPFETVAASAPIEPEAAMRDESPDEAPLLRSDGFLEPAFLDDLDRIVMSHSAYEEACLYFAERDPEAACLLLGPKRDALITHIVVDEEGAATPMSFTLAAASLNRKVKPYLAAGIDIKGVWHLHPRGCRSLSHGDIAYAGKVFINPKNQALDRFVMPITADGRFHGYVLARDGAALCIRYAQLVLV